MKPPTNTVAQTTQALNKLPGEFVRRLWRLQQRLRDNGHEVIGHQHVINMVVEAGLRHWEDVVKER